jgi:hypothetical protein
LSDKKEHIFLKNLRNNSREISSREQSREQGKGKLSSQKEVLDNCLRKREPGQTCTERLMGLEHRREGREVREMTGEQRIRWAILRIKIVYFTSLN